MSTQRIDHVIMWRCEMDRTFEYDPWGQCSESQSYRVPTLHSAQWLKTLPLLTIMHAACTHVFFSTE